MPFQKCGSRRHTRQILSSIYALHWFFLSHIIDQKKLGGMEISNGGHLWTIHPASIGGGCACVPSLECSGIPFGITAGGFALNSLSLFTDHPLLRVSLITSRALPRVIQDDWRGEDDDGDEGDVGEDEDEDDEATMPAGPPDT